MSNIIVTEQSTPPTPDINQSTIYVDIADNLLKTVDFNGVVHNYSGGVIGTWTNFGVTIDKNATTATIRMDASTVAAYADVYVSFSYVAA